jgi:hypothetical protein
VLLGNPPIRRPVGRAIKPDPVFTTPALKPCSNN